MTQQQGFTLIEMAIVLVIITILIGGLAVPLSAQIQARRIAETNRTLEEAREAIIGYAMTHNTVGGKPFLPCPDTNNDGIEEMRLAGKCPEQYGFLPWVTLGVGAQDAWGNRLRYATNNDVSNNDPGIDSSVVPAAGWLQICVSHTCPSGNIAENVPVVVLSHGPNSRGARNVGIPSINPTPAPPAGTSADELENLSASIRYVSRPPTTADHSSGEFDDLVVWIPYSLLYPRVCPTGCP